MNYTDNEIELFNDYMNYLLNYLMIEDIEWSCKKKWAVVIDEKHIEVISYHNWKIMRLREEKLNKLLGY